MLSLKNSLAVLKKTDALLEGHFVLSSGLHSPQYVQCAKLLSKPTQAKKFINSLATKIKRNIKDREFRDGSPFHSVSRDICQY